VSAIGFVRKALAMGVDLETALAMGEAFEAAQPVYVPPVGIVADPAMERRRAYDRERQAEKRAALKAASTGHPPTSADSAEVRERPLDIGPAKDAPAPVHTRGEDNLSRLVDTGINLTTLHSAGAFDDLDWPDSDKPSRAYLDRLEDALRDAAGPALASPAVAPKVKVLAAILALGRAGRGPPCDMQADVLPTVRARCARAPPASVKGWDYFTEAIREARDKRLTGAPAVETLHQGPSP
jgi:hypothetical protein